ncbi:MAG: hypothetical protein AB2777_21535 [Candidatus Thiodiazotropha endolucinida]
MPVPTDKQLHTTLLDMKITSDLQDAYIGDLSITLKDAKAFKRKIDRKLKKGIEKYIELYGRTPQL